MKTNVKVQKTYDLLELTAEDLKIISLALAAKSNSCEKTKELLKAITSMIVGDKETIESVDYNDDIELEDAKPYEKIMIPQEILPDIGRNDGRVRFILGKQGQLNFSILSLTDDSVEYKKPNIWLNKACVTALCDFLCSKDKEYHGYRDPSGKISYTKDLSYRRILNGNFSDIKIEKEDQGIYLYSKEVKCLKKFLEYHIEGEE
jgi:hypothetical protein